jgi:hypothetical protein
MSKTVLDPSCGRGEFLVGVARRMLAAGNTRVLACLYAADTSELNLQITKKRLEHLAREYGNQSVVEFNNMIHYNTIDKLSRSVGDMKFDIIVGNPPYQESKANGSRKDQASNLWSKFWSKSLKISTDQGIVAMITPTSWLSPSADLKGSDRHEGLDRLWDVFDLYDSVANVADVQKHFPGVGSSFGYVVVNKAGDGGLRFTDGADASLGFLPKSGHDEVRSKLSKTNNLGERFKIDQNNSPDLRVSIPMTRVLDADSIEILDGGRSPTKGSDKDGLYLYVHVNDRDQARRVRESLQGALGVLNIHCRWNGFLNIRVTKMVVYGPI